MEMATEFQSVFQPSLLGKRSAKNGFKTINTLIVYIFWSGEELILVVDTGTNVRVSGFGGIME